SELFNLNGLAHKVTFETEFFDAQSNQAMSQLPLYDRLDDNATEFTRRQMAVRTFGQPVGTFVPTRFDERFYALRSNLQGNVGARLTLLSDGFYDGFDQGLRQVTTGALMSRPQYGSVYIGYRLTEGPITSEVVTGTISYRMSEKWIATAGATYDFANFGVFGNQLSLTRVGESFLINVGFNYDASRNNFGAA